MNDIDPITAADHAPPALEFQRTPLMKHVKTSVARMQSASTCSHLQNIPKQDLHGLHGVSFDEILKAVTFAAESKGLSPKQFVCNNLAAAFEAENEAAKRDSDSRNATLRELRKEVLELTKQIGRYSVIIRHIERLNAAIYRLHNDESIPQPTRDRFRHENPLVDPTVFCVSIRNDAHNLRETATVRRNVVRAEIDKLVGGYR